MKVVINPKYAVLSSFVMSIHDSFEHEGEIIYDERNKLKRFSVAGYDLIVKRFRKPHLINQIAYTFFRSSKAERSFQNALKLLEKGISTPSPIAYIEEKKAGILNFSYYICIYEQDFSHIRNQMFGEAVSDNFYKQLAKYIADSHDNGVLHLDLSPGNILVKKTDENFLFSMVDINRMQFPHTITPEMRYKSFKRLTQNDEVLSSIATEYAIICNLDVQETKEKIATYSSNFFNSRKQMFRNKRNI